MRYLLSCIFVFACATIGAAAQSAEPVCIQCHDSDMMKAELRKIPGQWRQSWHYQNGVACNDCHGGDPADAAMAMSPLRGFAGKPAYEGVPEFCGKCHVGILKSYRESGHGKALKASGSGPNCVTCHGSHTIQKANIDIINEERCTQCHSYDRARIMKQALFATEKNIRDIDTSLKHLSSQGIYTEDAEKELFRIEAEFRTLFHTVDVSLVKQKTDGFQQQLDILRKKVNALVAELQGRRDFSGFLLLLFGGMSIVLFVLAKDFFRDEDK